MKRFSAKIYSIVLLAPLLLPASIVPPLAAQTEHAAFSVAPILATAPPSSGGFCDAPKLSLKIDSRPAIPWPRRETLHLSDLDPARSHLIVAVCSGKPIQSFKFRFAKFKSGRVCLTFEEEMFDGYAGLRLWDAKHAPWCK
jgi:hypothetical protein